MSPALRRIVAVEAHRRATGRTATLLHALGTGETFAIQIDADGFTDEESGAAARVAGDGTLAVDPSRIVLTPDGTVLFRGHDLATGERFSGRAGGGATVTLYDGDEFYQFNVVAED